MKGPSLAQGRTESFLYFTYLLRAGAVRESGEGQPYLRLEEGK